MLPNIVLPLTLFAVKAGAIPRDAPVYVPGPPTFLPTDLGQNITFGEFSRTQPAAA